MHTVASRRCRPNRGCRSHRARARGCPQLPYLTLTLTGVAAVTIDIARAGLAALPRSTIDVPTDTPTEITLAALPPGMAVELDGALVGHRARQFCR
jgi:hypothetical protein